MLGPFFRLAMIAPARQAAFRRAAVAHVLFCAAVAWWVISTPRANILELAGYALLGAGIVQGAVLIGWRLTQIPKSQALEFLLTSPIQPKRVFIAESLVGIARFLLVQLTGAIPLGLMVFAGRIHWFDLILFVVYPMIWGIVAGVGLTVWAYETILVKRIGEIFSGLGILVYLTVGVLAGERLRDWLQALPETMAETFFLGFRGLHEYNPFGIMQFWFDPINGVPLIALERAIIVAVVGLVAGGALYVRGMFRLRGHFHDRHYRPIDSSRVAQTEHIGDRPLSWWAVKRVMEFSGRVNIWLAGGFGILYAAYLLAGDAWPAWMGHAVFAIFDRMGGAPALITGLSVLAAVPAAFQYGLWDSSTQDRCRRLELLLLTELDGHDYWNAALAAAWRRGRGYMGVALMLVAAMLLGGRVAWPQAAACVAAIGLLWGMSFVVGFAAFGSGMQANGLGSMLTLGLPLIAVLLIRMNLPMLAAWIPSGAVYVAVAEPLTWTWFLGPMAVGAGTIWLARRVRERCEGDLRRWFDRNQGTQTAAV
ncbi:hypothetical protein [Zavarzinella formosa]|uniref:hypothetical protein n=1 Tax=Zavarzinella formosa TaxID=360055 RepID=UPI00030E0EC2|nr:hypothetical protein [Zavarzinella formosa]